MGEQRGSADVAENIRVALHTIDEDTSAWLGCPTPLEMYKRQCALLEDELTETQRLLCKARRNVAGPVQMNDGLATRLAEAEVALKDAQVEIGQLRERCAEPGSLGMKLVTELRAYLLRENQRLSTELSASKDAFGLTPAIAYRYSALPMHSCGTPMRTQASMTVS